ncbi:MAG TPA: hypothetical protein VJG30_02760 [Candidatus Nanoarchaeia archaeon]|nr:hypothetical protein [Candidatus Nanoarchaeia archaeon]
MRLKILIRILQSAIILFGFFIIYQVLRKIFGGSWSIEELNLSLLMLVVGMLFTIVIVLTQLYSDHNHLKTQFGSLATDFKINLKEFRELTNEFKSFIIEFRDFKDESKNLSNEFKVHIRKHKN